MGKFLDAALIILQSSPKPMTAQEITDMAVKLRLLEFSNGRTPSQTMKAKLSVHIRTYGSKSPFMRTAKGKFCRRAATTEEYTTPPWRKKINPREHVLVFPASEISAIGTFQLISRKVGPFASALLDPSKGLFISRTQAETDLRYKQVVSYVLVKRGSALLRFVRGSYSNVRTHLLGRYCIGFGGHVESRDMEEAPLFAAADSGYLSSVHRELNEELCLPPGAITSDSLRLIGVLNDDSTELGRLHFAFIHLLDLDHLRSNIEARLLKREKSINQLEFVRMEDLGKHFERYEYWSKLCIKTFFKTRIRIESRVQRIHNFRLRNHRRIIVVVGNIGSGKTEACRLLQHRFKYNLISSGQVIQEILDIPSVRDIGRERFQSLAMGFISRPDGPEVLANEIHRRVMNTTNGFNVVDGIRNVSTYEILRSKLKERLALIYVDSPVDSSFQMFRAREGRSLSLEEFYSLLNNKVEKEIGDFVKMCDVIFHNHGSRRSYIETITQYFDKELS